MGCAASATVKRGAGVKAEVGGAAGRPPASVAFPTVASIGEHYSIQEELRRGALNAALRDAGVWAWTGPA